MEPQKALQTTVCSTGTTPGSILASAEGNYQDGVAAVGRPNPVTQRVHVAVRYRLRPYSSYMEALFGPQYILHRHMDRMGKIKIYKLHVTVMSHRVFTMSVGL